MTAASRSPQSTCRWKTCRSATWCPSGWGCRSSSTTTPTSPPSPSPSTGPAADAEDMVLLTIGTGIGGGLILGGELYRGATGAGAELGHTVIDIDGPPCQGNCPGRGCIETLASGTALGREAREAAAREPDSALGAMLADGHEIDGKVVTEPALAGDAAAIAVFDLVGRRLGAALVSFANIFEPERDRGRRRRHGRRRPAARPGPQGAARAGAAADERDPRPRRRARPRRRPDRRRGAGPDRTREGGADAGPAGRLPDPDRQPRRRHHRGCARRWSPPTTSPARTRGAPAPCSTSSGFGRRRG